MGKVVIIANSVHISAEAAKQYGFIIVPFQSSQLQRKEICLAQGSAIVAVCNRRGLIGLSSHLYEADEYISALGKLQDDLTSGNIFRMGRERR